MGWLLSVLAIVFFANAAVAGDTILIDRGTKDEVVAMVQKAVELLKTGGPDKAYPVFDDPKGPFVIHDLYIFVMDQDGVIVAHGINPKLIGRNCLEDQDVDGNYMFKDRVELMKAHPTFWENRKWSDPLTHSVKLKRNYCEVVSEGVPKNVAVCAGYYLD